MQAAVKFLGALRCLTLAAVSLGLSHPASAETELAAAARYASTETVAVLGTGRVGAALGPRLAALGHPVIYGSRDPERPEVIALLERTGATARATTYAAAVAEAQIVIVALPWQATESALASVDLGDKLVIDPTNPMRMGREGLMEPVIDDGSAAERIAALAPRARIVKGFNAIGAHVMADPSAAGGPVTVPLVADDLPAKQRVGALVEALGFEWIDLGPLRHARQLEGLALLYMVPYLRGQAGESFEYYLRRGTAPRQSQGVRPAE